MSSPKSFGGCRKIMTTKDVAAKDPEISPVEPCGVCENRTKNERRFLPFVQKNCSSSLCLTCGHAGFVIIF
jgi:hypothetical protein